MGCCKTRRRWGGRLSLAVLVAEALFVCGTVCAQPKGDASARHATELTVKSAQRRLKEIEASKDLGKDLKGRLTEIHGKVVARLQAAEAWDRKAAEYKSQAETAPKLLAAIREELARPPLPLAAAVRQEATLSQLKQLLNGCAAERAALTNMLEAWKVELARLAASSKKNPVSMALARQGIVRVEESLKAAAAAKAPGPSAAAERTLLLATKKALASELRALKLEAGAYEATADLLTARLEKAGREARRLKKREALWQAAVNRKSGQEASRDARAAKAERMAARGEHAALVREAERNEKLAAMRSRVAERIADVTRDAARAHEALERLRAEFKSFRDKEAAVALASGIGRVLRRKREELPDRRKLRRELVSVQERIADTQLRLVETRDELDAIEDVEGRLKAVMAAVGPIPADKRAGVERKLARLLNARRDILKVLVKDYKTYFSKLIDLSASDLQLIAEARAFADYIDERILWVRSAPPIRPADLSRSWALLRRVRDRETWARLWGAVAQGMRKSPAPWVMGAALFVALLALLPALRGRLRRIADRMEGRDDAPFTGALKALAMTALISLAWPWLLWFVGWRLSGAPMADRAARATGAGLMAAARVWAVIAFLRALCLRSGLGEAHFGWSATTLGLIRRRLVWLAVVIAPTVFVFNATDALGDEAWENSVGRVALMVELATLAVFAHALLRPRGAVIREAVQRRPKALMSRCRYVVCSLAVVVPIALILLAAMGYVYTVQQLEGNLLDSVVLVIGMFLFDALLARALMLLRRLAELRGEEAAAKEDLLDAPPPEGAGEDLVEEGEAKEEFDARAGLKKMTGQTLRLLHSSIVFALIVGLWLIWSDVLPALGVLKRVTLYHVMEHGEKTPVTLVSLLLAAGLAAMTVVVSRNLPGLLDIGLLRRLPISRGVRYAVETCSRYVVAVVGIIVVCGTMGLSWAKIQWLVAAMTVGLGFGLQEIFANFVSGLIILFERPMRVGDTVTVGGVTGTVTRIRIRATTITDWDRKELIVPNKEFITGQLVNWTLSDTIVRIVSPVGIAYGSDTRLAEQLLLRVAAENDEVLIEPPPTVVFSGFGDSSLDFQLRAFIPTMENYNKVRHQINVAIDNAFREAGISIPFPQRDVHMRSGSPGPRPTEAGEP